MPSPIVVTGAPDFIGSDTDQLLAEVHAVWGVDNFRTGNRKNLLVALPNRNFVLRALDVTDKSAFNDLVRGVRPEIVIHLAAPVSVPENIANPALNDKLKFQATAIVEEAAGHSKQVSRIVFASTPAVYGSPIHCLVSEKSPAKPVCPYGSAKLASEQLLLTPVTKDKFVGWCHWYFNVYGPRQVPGSSYSGVISIFLDQMQRNVAPIIYGDAEQTRDFVSVPDAARANVLAETRQSLTNGLSNICTDRATRVNALWKLLSRDRATPLAARYLTSRAEDIRHSYGLADIADTRLGFRAKIPLSESLAELVARSQKSHA